MSIGERLKEIRKVKGLSQSDLAGLAGITKGYISQLEADLKEPGSKILSLLKKTLNININWLLTGEGEMFLEETRSPEQIREIIKTQFNINDEQYSLLARAIQSKPTTEMLTLFFNAREGDKEAIAELKGAIKLLELNAESK